MIVNSMTEAELMREILDDMVNVLAYSDSKDGKFRRMVLKSSRFPVRAHSIYMSPRRNRWIICFEARNKKMHSEESLITCTCLQETTHGFYAYYPHSIEGNMRLNIYPPHFFSRYAERLSIAKSREDLILHFAQRNIDASYKHTKGRVVGRLAEGVALGVLTEHCNHLFKTFISVDMALDNQEQLFDSLEDLRSEIHSDKALKR